MLRIYVCPDGELFARQPSLAFARQAAEVSANLVAIAREFQRAYPVSATDVRGYFLNRFMCGDPIITLEVTAAVREKDPKFGLLDFTALRELADGHSKSMPIQPTVSITNLEETTFEVLMKQLQYDVEAFGVFRRRCVELEHAVYWQQLRHKMEVQENAAKAADHFLQQFSCFMVADGGPEQVLSSIRSFQKQVSTASQSQQTPVLRSVVGKPNKLARAVIIVGCAFVSAIREHSRNTQAMIPFINLVAPSTMKEKFIETALSAAAILSNEGPNNPMIMLTPMFSYKRGQIFMQEKALLDRVLQKGLVCDKSFSLLFKQKCDAREAPASVHAWSMMVGDGG